MFKDVTIINDSLAYAVGGIYLLDSTGQIDQTPYCLAQWNGQKWSLSRMTYIPPGSIGGSVNAIGTSIFANKNDDIWFSAGAVFHFDGKSWSYFQNTLGAEGAYKIWGDGNGKLWFVGRDGLIVHYNNGTWQKIESGTTEDIQDIWGGSDASGTSYALAVVSTIFYGGDSKLLRITGSNVENLNTNGLSWSISGIWFSNKSYYITGAEVYSKNSLLDTVWNNLPVAPTSDYGYTYSVRGSAWNDVAVAGAFGTLLHYNGSTWRNFTQQLNLPNVIFNSVAIKGNLIVAVGVLGSSRGIIARGLRIN
jgi:hypothetical protein